MYTYFNMFSIYFCSFMFLLISLPTCNCWKIWEYDSHTLFFFLLLMRFKYKIFWSLFPLPHLLPDPLHLSRSRLAFSLFVLLSLPRTHILFSSVMFLFGPHPAFHLRIAVFSFFSLLNFLTELVISIFPL